MFTKYQNVFRSRWKALIWAGGVLVTAYCTVPSPDQDNSAALPFFDTGAKGSGSHAAHKHVNPWALDPPKKSGAG
ncbi:MAG: hypothetical protein ACTHK5_07430 [Tsuneonella sp.]